MTTEMCVGCEEQPIRAAGKLVSTLEGWTGQRLYCVQCAADCDAGRWESAEEDA